MYPGMIVRVDSFVNSIHQLAQTVKPARIAQVYLELRIERFLIAVLQGQPG